MVEADNIILGGDTLGDIYFRGASGLNRLPAGTSGQFLKTLGDTAGPMWSYAPSSGLINIKDYGAVGDGVADDRQAIQDAIYAAAALGIKAIYVPPGVYRICRTTIENVGTGIHFTNMSGIRMFGAGPHSSIIKMDKDFEKGFRLLRIISSSSILIDHLQLNGNWAGETGHEQIHLTEITTDGSDCVDVNFYRVAFRDCRGDGFRTLGDNVGNYVRRARADYCSFINVKRAPVAGQRASIDCALTHSWVESGTDSAFDFEPTGTSPTKWDISHNTILHKSATASFVFDLVGGAGFMEDTNVSFNKIYGGGLSIRKCRNAKIIGNTVISRSSGTSGDATFRIVECENSFVSGNTFTRPLGAPAGNVVLLTTDGGVGNKNTVLIGNTIRQYSDAHVVEIASAAGTILSDNTIDYFGTTVGLYRGIFGTTTVTPGKLDLTVDNNTINGNRGGGTLSRAVFVNSNVDAVGKISVINNHGSGFAYGAEFTGGSSTPGFTSDPVFHGNDWDCLTGSYKGSFATCPGLKKLMTGGNKGGICTFEGPGAPTYAAVRGSQHFRTDGTVSGTNYYINTSGSTGWTGIA